MTIERRRSGMTYLFDVHKIPQYNHHDNEYTTYLLSAETACSCDAERTKIK